jgi:hypothetical protein
MHAIEDDLKLDPDHKSTSDKKSCDTKICLVISGLALERASEALREYDREWTPEKEIVIRILTSCLGVYVTEKRNL